MSAVPTRDNTWWWRKGERKPVEVIRDESGIFADCIGCFDTIHDDGRWLAEIPSPDRLAALERCAEALKSMQMDLHNWPLDVEQALAALAATEPKEEPR